MLDQEDLQLIEQFNAENLQQKNRIRKNIGITIFQMSIRMIVLRKHRPMSSTL
jgi:hypothetical protein